MGIFVQSTKAAPAKTKNLEVVSLILAAILTGLTVSQLFTFDEFVKLLQSFNLPVSDAFSYALAPLLIVGELFAIPFLLRMQLSVAFRWLSMILSWFVALTWLLISVWVINTQPQASTVGYFGTAVNVSAEWWAVLIPISLGILAALASWGLWPSVSRKLNSTTSSSRKKA